MARLNKEQIENALRELGAAAAREGLYVRLLVVGGAAMVLGYGARERTQDVDAVIRAPEDAARVRRLAASIAAKLGLPPDWLNDAAKGYVRPPVQETIVLEAPGITVAMPSSAQLAAMKFSAWRDDRKSSPDPVLNFPRNVTPAV